MGFVNFNSDTGLSTLDSWLRTRSYIVGYCPSQADVKVFQAVTSPPKADQYPHVHRWYKHAASFEAEFASLPGDPNKDVSAYGPANGDEDDIDLFASDDEEVDQEAEKVRQQRLADYRKKKEGKAKPAAKSVVILDVKPWDDETDMNELEAAVRAIEKEGLVWGTSKLVAIGFGIKKLQINLVIEDEKVSLTELEEEIGEIEEYVQSTDVQAMQKL